MFIKNYMVDLENNNIPIIINPNLGQPTLLNLKDFQFSNSKFTENVLFEAIVVALPNQSTTDVIEEFKHKLYIQPVLKDEGEFEKRRGKKYSLDIYGIEKAYKKKIQQNHNKFDDFECQIWDVFHGSLRLKNIYGKRAQLFKISLKIVDIEEIFDLIKRCNTDFLIFDIIYENINKKEIKSNYHSLAIYNKDWKDFRFIHASDLHIASRNDYIIKSFKEIRESKEESYINIESKSNLGTNNTLRDFEYRENFQEKRLEQLKSAKYNPNYALRLFIGHVNKKVAENSLDFVLFTGDLVDYVHISPKYNGFNNNNNFHVLLEILLGINQDSKKYSWKDKEFVNTKEILVPLFTVVGNHDYRKGHYSLSVAKSYKSYGFHKDDFKIYNHNGRFNYFNAIYPKTKNLKEYFRHFNANLNFKVDIGNSYSFIFLDTGKDSLANWPNLLKGNPTTKGLVNSQIKLLRHFLERSQNKKIIIVMHTPPISPRVSPLKEIKYRNKLNMSEKHLKWSNYYEENLKQHDIQRNLNKILNLKHKSYMNNWSTLLKILLGSDKKNKKKVDLLICGHTHTLREYRLRQKKETKMINFGYWIFPAVSIVPCAVYTSNYSEKMSLIKNSDDLNIWFEANKPFVFQTQALGLLSRNNEIKSPGFRYYDIKDHQIINNKIYSLHLQDNSIEPEIRALSDKHDEIRSTSYEDENLQMSGKIKIGVKQ